MNFRTLFLGTALAGALALAPASTFAQETPVAVASAAHANVGIENFGKINDRYYRGAQPYGEDYATLAALGVKTIIDLQEADGEPDEATRAREAGITYHRIPMSTRRPPTAEQLAQFFKLVSDPAGGAIYVHCKGGRHRTGVMTAAYRMSFDSWTSEQAYDEMKRFDFGPSFLHPEFKEYVYEYDATRIPVRVATATSQQ